MGDPLNKTSNKITLQWSSVYQEGGVSFFFTKNWEHVTGDIIKRPFSIILKFPFKIDKSVW